MPVFDYNSYRNLDATKKGLKGPVDCLPELIHVCDGKPAILHTLLENELSKAQIDEVNSSQNNNDLRSYYQENIKLCPLEDFLRIYLVKCMS